MVENLQSKPASFNCACIISVIFFQNITMLSKTADITIDFQVFVWVAIRETFKVKLVLFIVQVVCICKVKRLYLLLLLSTYDSNYVSEDEGRG